MKNKSSFLAPHLVSSTYAYLLVVAGIWAYFDTGVKSQFITVILGVVILIMNNGVQYGTKEAKYVALITTALSLYVVARPMNKYLLNADFVSAARTGLMLAVGLLSFMVLAYNMFIAKQVQKRKKAKI